LRVAALCPTLAIIHLLLYFRYYLPAACLTAARADRLVAVLSVRQHPFYKTDLFGFVNCPGPAHTPDPRRLFAGLKMALAAAMVFDLATLSQFKSFAYPFFGF
jgi:hypothetical protein